MSVSSSGTAVSSAGGVGSPAIIDYGVGSGLNTQAIIEAELEPYEEPEQQLESQQTTLNTNVSDYQQINTDLLALQTQAESLATTSGWQARSATSSDSSVAAATAANGTPAGSVQFTVSQLAAANSLISSGSVSSTSQVVTSAPSILLAQGAAQLGFATLGSGSGLTLGSHTVAVTQASQAASSSGSADLSSAAGGIGVDGTDNTLDVTVNNTAYSLSIAASPTGGYSGSGLLSAVQSAISAAGASGVLQAGYNSAGQLVLATAGQGSSQSLQVTGGSALAALGLTAMASAATGVDGVVELDGVSNTLSDVQAGAALTLNGPGGSSLGVTLESASAQAAAGSSLLSAGTLTATNISTGNGSLSDVVANINNAGSGVVASDIQTGTSQYILELTSSTTGTSSDISVSSGTFAGSALGALNVASAGQNAEIQIGGANGYTLQSQNDTFSGLLPGLTVNVQSASTNPVTVTVAPDSSSMASQVKTLVNDANTVLSDVSQYAGYNASTKTGGPLMGSATLQSVTNEIESIFASTEGSSSLGDAMNVGITLSNGQLQFNESTFESAFSSSPNGVAAMFTQGGTFSPAQPAYTGQVTLNYASNTSAGGSYDVNISQSASQATATGSVLSSGTVTSAEQLAVGFGGTSVQYSTAAGESLTSVAAGLNELFANSSVPLSAQVTGGGQQLQVVSDAYGSSASFSVATSNDGPGTTGLAGAGQASGTFTGTDVEGTIDGVAGTGDGQFLSAPSGTSPLNGLTLQITTPGISSATDLGQYTYAPGIAQALSTLGAAMSDPVSGAITQTISGMRTESLGLASQITYYSKIVSQEQTLLTNQYANLDATINSLTNQSTTLSSELGQIAANG